MSALQFGILGEKIAVNLPPPFFPIHMDSSFAIDSRYCLLRCVGYTDGYVRGAAIPRHGSASNLLANARVLLVAQLKTS